MQRRQRALMLRYFDLLPRYFTPCQLSSSRALLMERAARYVTLPLRAVSYVMPPPPLRRLRLFSARRLRHAYAATPIRFLRKTEYRIRQHLTLTIDYQL